MKTECKTPVLQEGMAYTLYLKNGRKVFNAIYYPCVVSGKSYFEVGGEIIPAEDVHVHSIIGYDCSSSTCPDFADETSRGRQVLTEDYYGRKLEVTILTTNPVTPVEFIPDSVKELVFNAWADDDDEGTFDHNQTGERMVVSGQPSVYTTFEGSWRILPLDFDYFHKVAMWEANYAAEEALTRDLFIMYYGNCMGQHYYGKWTGEAKRSILWMLRYFDSKDGQRFCNMIAEQVQKYEKRTGDNHGTEQSDQ